MSSILVTIPDQVASAFIDHLAKLHPRIANQITIRVLEDSTAQRVIDELDDMLPLEELLDHTGGMYHKELEDYEAWRKTMNKIDNHK